MPRDEWKLITGSGYRAAILREDVRLVLVLWAGKTKEEGLEIEE